MNWKLILGILMVFGFGKEMLNIMDLHQKGVKVGPSYPLTIAIMSLAVLGGVWLIYAGRKKRKSF